jgi:hypothetical protein
MDAGRGAQVTGGPLIGKLYRKLLSETLVENFCRKWTTDDPERQSRNQMNSRKERKKTQKGKIGAAFAFWSTSTTVIAGAGN